MNALNSGSILRSSQSRKGGFLKEFRENGILYLMSLPGMVLLFIFSYLPMSGIYMAFTDYKVKRGIFGSEFVGFDNFTFFVTSGDRALKVIVNTVVLNALFITAGLIFQMGIAILMNEITNKTFKKVSQSVMFFPYFLSWVVIGAIVYSLFATDVGVVNSVLKSFGLDPVRWYGEKQYWKAILTGANIWKWSGYGSIVYLAAIAGFDPSFYEAATVDGATKFQKIKYITLPLLKPTAVTMVLFSIGRIFYGDFGMIYGIIGQNGILLEATEVIDNYVFMAMRSTLGFSGAAAIGVIQSVLGLIMILGANKLAKKINDGVGLF